MSGLAVVGREAELFEVEAFLDAAADGFAALVLEGEAGIGKTTVWWEARRRAEQRDALVLACRMSAAEAKFSFAGVADLLSALGEEAFEGLPAPQRAALDVALLRAAPTGQSGLASAVAAAFLGVLRGLAETREILVAVDDWQWLDVPSRRVLEFAARRLETERIGLLCTVRAPSTVPPITGAVADARLRRMTLDALSLAALGRIVADELGRSLPRPLLERISQASRGNPFYALEIARLLDDQGSERSADAGIPVPDDLRRLTAARIRRLPRDAREVVLLAAVLSAPDIRTIDVESLASAEQAGIVRVDDQGRVEFAHPLLASAAYRSLSSARRRQLHRHAAELVSDPEQQARHLAFGSDRSDDVVAAQLDAAAALAEARGAPDAAAEFAELAAARTPADHTAAHAARLLHAARFHFDVGDLGQAEALAREVITGSATRSLRASALQLAAQLSARRSNFTEAAGLATAALDCAGEDDRLRAGIRLDLVYCAVSLGDLAVAEVQARAAVRDAKAAGDKGVLADALAVVTMAEFLGGRGFARDRLETALALEEGRGVGAFLMRPHVIDGMLELWTGELDRALASLGAVHAETTERGQEGLTPMLSLYLVWAAVWRGELEQAARWSEEALTAARLLEDPTTSGISLAASALVHAHDGRTELARTEATEACSLFERLEFRSGLIWPLWALGLAELSEENPAAVDGLLGPLAQKVAAMGPGDPVLAMFLPDEIEALIELGALNRAQAYLEPFETRARELDRPWALAAAARCRGALASARGEPELAFGSFERALAEHERTTMPLERARTLLVTGTAYRRSKQWGRARAALKQALELFERVGAPRWAERARAQLARIGGVAVADDGLTETELRIANLAALGLSNHQVAERAFVSVKTVEANLTRVYRKLGLRSRGGLARALKAVTQTS